MMGRRRNNKLESLKDDRLVIIWHGNGCDNVGHSCTQKMMINYHMMREMACGA